MPSSSSGNKIDYALRPKKQIERRIIIDLLIGLSELGFPINAYKYIGFGSYYFYDFKLIHKYIGISKMISLEWDEDAIDRCSFNKPYSCISILSGSLSSNLDVLGDEPVIAWLDYEGFVTSEKLNEIEMFTREAALGSVLITTHGLQYAYDIRKQNDYDEFYSENFRSILGNTFASPTNRNSSAHREGLTHAAIYEAIRRGISSRTDKSVHQNLFQFSYKDSSKMCSFGGVICDSLKAKDIVKKFKRQKHLNVTETKQLYDIYYPVLTKKEKRAIDERLPRRKLTKKLLDLDCIDFDRYKEIYRFSPNYGELLDE